MINCLLCGNRILAPKAGQTPGGEHKRRMHYICLYSAYNKLNEVYQEATDSLTAMTKLEVAAQRESKKGLTLLIEKDAIIRRLQAQIQDAADRRSIPIPRAAATSTAKPPAEPEKKVDRFTLIEFE